MSRDVKLDMALDINGKLIDVDDAISFDEWKAKCVASGIKNTKHKEDFVYKCPNCGEKVSSVRGEHNEHHFRHIDGFSGEYHSADSIIHTNTQIMINDVLNQLISNGIPLKCSSINVYGNNKSNEMSNMILVGDNETYSYNHDFLAGATKSTIEGKINNETNHRADILISNHNEPLLAIEIINTHHDTKEKTALYESLNIDVIKVNISNHEDYETIKKDYLDFINDECCFFLSASITINNRFILDLVRGFEDFYTELKDYDKNIVETAKLYSNYLKDIRDLYKLITSPDHGKHIVEKSLHNHHKVIPDGIFIVRYPSKHVTRRCNDFCYWLVSENMLCFSHIMGWLSDVEFKTYISIITDKSLIVDNRYVIKNINKNIEKQLSYTSLVHTKQNIVTTDKIMDGITKRNPIFADW